MENKPKDVAVPGPRCKQCNGPIVDRTKGAELCWGCSKTRRGRGFRSVALHMDTATQMDQWLAENPGLFKAKTSIITWLWKKFKETW